MKINLSQKQLNYPIEGKPFSAKSFVFSEEDQDLSKGQPWHDDGFVILPLFDKQIYPEFINSIDLLLKQKLKNAGLTLPKNFRLEDYHKIITNYSSHLSVVNHTKLIDYAELPEIFEKLEQRVSDILGFKVKSKKPLNGETVFHFRVIRPNEPDYNPPHKDVWQDENRGAINIYVPIAGSTANSSLIIAKGSHLLDESTFIRTQEGAKMNNIQFNVPGLLDSKTDLHFERINPKENELLIFSSYTIHGGAANLNLDETRISLEMRFWQT